MRKYTKIIALFIVFIIVFCSCTKNNDGTDNNPQNNEIENNEGTEGNGNNMPAQNDEIIGQLYEINNNDIKVMSNGASKSYTITGDRLKDYYVGEYIRLKPNGTDYDISLYENYDFNNRKTETGDLISRVTGNIKDIGDEYITAQTENGDIKLNNPGNFALPKETSAIFDYIATDKGNVMVNYYDESVKLDLMIDKITRNEKGYMIISASANDKSYEITVKPSTVVNITLSSLKNGDKIAVYPTSLSDDNPAKVDASMLLK